MVLLLSGGSAARVLIIIDIPVREQYLNSALSIHVDCVQDRYAMVLMLTDWVKISHQLLLTSFLLVS